MSEFQYYDFYSIDRPLTREEQEKISTYSSRVEPTSRRAVFVYHYSDFRYDEVEVLNEFFDMMLYIANWGSYRLMIKVPADLVSLRDLQAFNYEAHLDYESYIRIVRIGENIIIDLYFAEEDPNWIETEGQLDRMFPLREQILRGDFRVLYLAWLKLAVDDEEYDDFDGYDDEEEGDVMEPSVPQGLKKLDVALESFVDFWQIPRAFIDAGSDGSEPTDQADEVKLSDYIDQLSVQELKQYATLLLEDEIKAKYALRKHLKNLLPQRKPRSDKRRTITEIQDLVAQKSFLIAEKLKREKELAFIQKMEDIGARQAAMWREIDTAASLKTARGYEDAADLLKELKEYAVHADELESFAEKLILVREKYGKSVAFRRRLEARGI